MATIKQKRAFKEIVENGRNKGKAMILAGYSENTAIAPTKLTESKGWQELCDEHGLTDELLNFALVEDIKKKKGNRCPELTLAYKIKGRMIEKQDITSKGEKIKNANLIGIDLSTKSYEELRRFIAQEDTDNRGMQDE